MPLDPPARPRRFLGWDTVVGGAIFQALQAALVYQSFGIYVVAWSDEFGWTRAAIAGGYAIALIESGLIGPLHGSLLERFGVRPVMAVGILALALGLVGLSLMTSLATFYTSMLFAGLGLALSGFLSTTTAVVPWFVRRRSTALSLMAIGMSGGGLLVPLVAAAVVDLGWRSMLQLGAALVIAIGAPSLVLMRRDPASYGQVPDGRARPGRRPRPTLPSRASAGDFTLQQALRTRAFWLLGIGQTAAVLVGGAVTVHLVAHLTLSLDFSVQAAAQVIAFLTVVSVAGQLVGGPIGDRFDIHKVAAVAMVGQALGMAILAHAASAAAVVLFATLHGLAWGIRGPLMSAVRADYFGTRSFGSIMGASMMVLMVGDVVGPILTGTLADRLGDYRVAFSVIAGLAVMASVAFWFAKPPVLAGTTTSAPGGEAPNVP
jgi:MFS family permease